MMRLVAGLGNPGSRYARHRHNIGFMTVDAITRRHGSHPFRRRFRGEAGEVSIGGEKILLLNARRALSLA